MLVLSRKKTTCIIIDKDIKITYLGTDRRGQCRLGIEAPVAIKVYREEIYKKIQEQEQKSHPETL
jgi:carbon storage regulator